MTKAYLAYHFWKVFHKGDKAWPFLFNICKKDLLDFIITCSLIHYADDNTSIMISSTSETVLSVLRATLIMSFIGLETIRAATSIQIPIYLGPTYVFTWYL